MSKAALKKAIAIEQGGLDAITGQSLPTSPKLFDPDRLTPKADGGTYDNRLNVRVLHPRTHMARHGILRDREQSLENIKSIFDDRVQVMKLQLKINNQLLAYERRVDHKNDVTVEFLNSQLKSTADRLMAIDKTLSAAIKKHPDPLVKSALGVKGMGPITVAALIVYVDLEKAATPSALWQYVGIDRASHERYKPNPEQMARRKARGPAYYNSTHDVPTGWGGNKTLRTVLWNTANVMMKLGEGPYRLVYDRVKERLSNSEKVVKTRDTKGDLVEKAWKDTKASHRHGAALRAVMKHLLADYWMVGRTLAGLSTTPMYAEAMLGHTHIVNPKERGWEF